MCPGLRPLIGGTFANPTTENLSWPRGHLPIPVNKLFKEFPYLLPCVVTSVMALAATAFAFCVLEEVSTRRCCATSIGLTLVIDYVDPPSKAQTGLEHPSSKSAFAYLIYAIFFVFRRDRFCCGR